MLIGDTAVPCGGRTGLDRVALQSKATRAREPARPSFLLVMTDTQPARAIGAYGVEDVQTPSLDALAARGMRFDRAYTSCPVCTPARAGIFTGMMPSSTGAWANDMPLGSNVATLGQRLQRHGYHTAYVGKWHLDGHDYFGTGRCPPGWEPQYWYDGLRYLSDLSAEQRALWRGGLRSAEAIRQAGIDAEFTWAHRVVDRSLAFIDGAADADFLLAVSFDEPHEPFTCPFEYVARFADFDFPVGASVYDSLEDKPEIQRRWAAARPVSVREGYRRPLYFGCGSFVDAEIGRLLAGLRASGRDDVWVIFTSDHGEMMGGHRLTGKGPAMYEEITRIPLIVARPDQRGEVPRARQCTCPVSHLDIVPTVLDLAGVARPDILAGVSLRPLLDRGGNAPTGPASADRTAPGAAPPRRSAVHIEFNRFSRDGNKLGGLVPIRAATDGRLKLAINRDDRDELYDLDADPAELVNRIEDPALAEHRDALHDAILARMEREGDPFRGSVWVQRPWRRGVAAVWHGAERGRLDDGWSPTFRDYGTGEPWANG